jgi:succinate dehydrogenase / fumarate reductase cytochrome b subunit
MRPLSPHLLIYKLPLPALMSIFHRITGVGFVLGIYLFLWWLYALVYEGSSWELFLTILQTPFVSFVLFGIILSACFHFFNGIRYMIWSLGIGFEVSTVYQSGYIILMLTVLSTFYIWLSI